MILALDPDTGSYFQPFGDYGSRFGSIKVLGVIIPALDTDPELVLRKRGPWFWVIAFFPK